MNCEILTNARREERNIWLDCRGVCMKERRCPFVHGGNPNLPVTIQPKIIPSVATNSFVEQNILPYEIALDKAKA